MLAVLKGEIIVKDGSNKILNIGDLYNVNGFLLGYTSYCNIFCSSNDAACLIFYKEQLQNLLSSTSFQKLCTLLTQH